ncbi:Serpin domain containing protein [Asbolus verrucosus]|uniref:Serpin domain containing protein n=1 Tax=Asbolus verrucosus TaxID=1661398 RepID=A0A482VEL3_ASBVE|nr:Serpin domain containing protein [Asbolus verrucosus]
MKRIFNLLLILAVNIAENEASLQEFVKGNNLFAASLYKQMVRGGNANFLTSPYSAETVFAFVHSGSKGETAHEIQKSLHLPDAKREIEVAIKMTMSDLESNDLYTFHSANKMYIKEGMPLKKEFRNTAIGVFKADIENIDFGRNEEAAKTIDDWVEKQTSNKIKNLINSKGLDGSTISVLINAIYFKADWRNKFLASNTKLIDFHKTKNLVVKVSAMHHNEKWFNYSECSELNAKFLELPFEDEDVSMIIVLPNEIEGLASLEANVEKTFALRNFSRELVNVALPKFKIETKTKLMGILKNLGIKKAFNGQEADLSGIAGEKGDLVITDALQKTYIDVAENGVEAAAATYIGMFMFPI